MVQAAQRTGVERFLFFSALGAHTHSRARFLRAKALAEQAVQEAGVRSIVFAPSLVYAPGNRWLTLLERQEHTITSSWSSCDDASSCARGVRALGSP